MISVILTLRNIMSSIVNDPRVLSLVGRQGFKGGLEAMLDQLNRCQKALSEFLEVSGCTTSMVLVLYPALIGDCRN